MPITTTQQTDLVAWLRTESARLLAADPADLDETSRFVDLGLDSIRITALAAGLSDRLGSTISPALLWAHPTIRGLVAHLAHPDDAVEPALPARPVRHSAEPVAVVGLACRFPGAETLEAFWSLLRSGTDAVRPVPADRWTPDPRLLGGRVPTQAGFIDQPVDAFDPLFFGISPREAAQIDPQQRLFLEVAWEALESAGLANATIRGSRTGVFAGAIWHDYADLHAGDLDRLSTHTATGQALNMVANRLSYALGLCGPSITLDTACSSSLLAVHLACQSIATGECETALAGGVNLLLSEQTMAALARFGGLAPDGRCKAFDASGDGFGRGEGCGVVVLKSLSRALADGDQIWAVVKGSAVNNDGPSNGLTAPNPVAQQDVLRRAYERARVSPADVHYVETHGTGTALGDPIEASALGAVLGAGRSDREPLLIGSVKTNLGHLEAAAGIAGFIKTVLALRHGRVPANLHFTTPNPHIDFDALRVRVPSRHAPWPASRRLAGVSSFGWGGTNVHVVLGGWSEPAPLPRLVAAASPATPSGKLAFVCSPHGHQWTGMGRSMLRTEPVFRAIVERCDRALAPLTGWSLLAELHAEEDPARAADVSVVQPLLFSVQVALAGWLESRGVRPDAVVGHSLGEIAAAVIAGMLPLEEAARLVHHYSRHQRRIAADDQGMAVAELSAAEIGELCAPGGPYAGLSVAAHNGPRSTAVAGDVPTLRRLLAGLKDRGVLCALIKVNVAAHSAAIDRVGADLITDIGELATTPGRIPMFSTLTGRPIETGQLDGSYFAAGLRSTVLLAEATAAMLADGCDTVVELSAHPVLQSALEQSAATAGITATVLGTMARGDDDRLGVWSALRELGRRGHVRTEPAPPATPELVTVCAASATALASAARQLAAALETRPIPVADLAAATARRDQRPYRLAAVAESSGELTTALREFADGAPAGGFHSSAGPARRPRVAFVFPGQGSQWLGMGRDLLEQEPAFAAAVRACDAAASSYVDFSILRELTAEETRSQLDRIDVVQPTLFAVEYALACLWESWGVRPDAVVGHSMGEVAAAAYAGALSLDDAARIICERSRLMRRQSGRGAMLLVELSAPEAAEALGARTDASVAVCNSARSTVLSGDCGVLAQVAQELAARDVFCRWVKVDVASHSPQMAELRDDLVRLLATVRGWAPRIPMHSTVTGGRCTGPDLDAAYWFANLRSPVLFADQIEHLIADGCTAFVEQSPHPILLPAVQQVAAAAGATGVAALPSLRRGEPARAVLLGSVAELYVRGTPVDRERVSTPGRRTAIRPLPSYPWQRERLGEDVVGPTPRAQRRELLGEGIESALQPGTHLWRVDLDRRTAEIADHVIGGEAIVPAALWADLALRAARQVFTGRPPSGFVLERLRFRAPLAVAEQTQAAQLVLIRDESHARLRIFDGERTCVAEGEVSVLPAQPEAPGQSDLAAIQVRLAEADPGAELYADLAGRGFAYGPGYRRIGRIHRGTDDVVAELDAPLGGLDHLLHPGLLDGALQTALVAALPFAGADRRVLVTAGVERLVAYAGLNGRCLVRSSARRAGPGYRADVAIFSATGTLLAEAIGVTLLRSAATAAPAPAPAREGAVERSESRAPEAIPPGARDSLLQIPDRRLRRRALEQATAECVAAVARTSVARIDPDMTLNGLGIDSLMTMELRNRLEQTFGVKLSPTVILAHPTVRELVPQVAQRAGILLDAERC
ncbi:acyltransferase domain-containing protein [Microlunatus ginsengisoli]|uniref:Acyl transferase domain-containing protein n=1 Tax=Microlunatus ginsengisoli TaxID=363863 RepID=A0ABP7AHY5_9ACTN